MVEEWLGDQYTEERSMSGQDKFTIQEEDVLLVKPLEMLRCNCSQSLSVYSQIKGLAEKFVTVQACTYGSEQAFYVKEDPDDKMFCTCFVWRMKFDKDEKVRKTLKQKPKKKRIAKFKVGDRIDFKSETSSLSLFGQVEKVSYLDNGAPLYEIYAPGFGNKEKILESELRLRR